MAALKARAAQLLLRARSPGSVSLRLLPLGDNLGERDARLLVPLLLLLPLRLLTKRLSRQQACSSCATASREQRPPSQARGCCAGVRLRLGAGGRLRLGAGRRLGLLRLVAAGTRGAGHASAVTAASERLRLSAGRCIEAEIWRAGHASHNVLLAQRIGVRAQRPSDAVAAPGATHARQ